MSLGRVTLCNCHHDGAVDFILGQLVVQFFIEGVDMLLNFHEGLAAIYQSQGELDHLVVAVTQSNALGEPAFEIVQ